MMLSDDQARAAGIKQTRREILKALAIMYPDLFSFEAICSAILYLELPDDEVVKKDMVYLCDKGYVAWTNPGDFISWKNRMYKLTPRGNEIANKIEIDPALEP